MTTKLKILLLIYCLIIVSGCGFHDHSFDQNKSNEGKRDYIISSSIVQHIENSSSARDFKLSSDGNCVFYASMDSNECACIKKISINSDDDIETIISEEGYYLAYSLDANTVETLMVVNDLGIQLNNYDNGKQKKSILFNEADFDGKYPFFICSINMGYLVCSRNNAFLYDEKGVEVLKSSCPGNGFINVLKISMSSCVVSYSKDNGKYAVATLNVMSGEYTNEYELDFFPLLLCQDGDYCLISDGDIIATYKTNPSDVEMTYCLSRKSFSKEDIKAISTTEDGIAVLAYNSVQNPGLVKMSYLLATVSDSPLYSEEYDEEGRRIIYVYSHISSSFAIGLLGQIAEDFMFEHPEYCIRFMDYDSTIDFVLDKNYKPDLLCELTPYIITHYGEKGYLEDLWPYIDSSNNLSIEDINNTLPACYEIDGKLYGITDSVSVLGIRVSDAPEEYGDVWTIEEFLNWINDNPNVRSLGGVTKSSILSYCLLGSMNEFVNLESMTSSFDSEEYIELLNQIDSLVITAKSETPLGYSSDMTEELEGNAYLCDSTIGSVNQLATEEARIGKKLKYIGYPTYDDKPCGILLPVYNLALTTKGECKDGAYAFLEYCLLKYGEKIKAAKYDSDIYFQGEFCVVNTFLEQNMSMAKGTDFLGFMYEDDYHEFEVTEDHVIEAKRILSYVRSDSSLERMIRQIALEEFESLEAGSADPVTIARITQNRVRILLEESK